MLGHRLPQRGIGGVVVHHNDLEIRIVQPREGIQSLTHQMRRLVADRHMHRHFRQARAGTGRHRQETPARRTAP
jgi:hypothetical protein